MTDDDIKKAAKQYSDDHYPGHGYCVIHDSNVAHTAFAAGANFVRDRTKEENSKSLSECYCNEAPNPPCYVCYINKNDTFINERDSLREQLKVAKDDLEKLCGIARESRVKLAEMANKNRNP